MASALVHALMLAVEGGSKSLLVVSPPTVAATARLDEWTVQDVQEVLKANNLGPFLGPGFEENLIDGNMLQLLDRKTLLPQDFPTAKPFHWTKFWALLNALKDSSNRDSETFEVSPQGDGAEPALHRRRRLAGGDGDFSGIHINKENAAVIFGKDQDAAIKRTGDKQLSIQGRLLVANSTGGSLDVAQQLEDLRQRVDRAGSDDERIDTLLEMVSLNTELLLNVSTSCASAGAALSTTSQVPVYTCMDTLRMESASGAYLTEEYGYVHCQNDLSIGGWTLAMNIDTSDGNVVDYNNAAFWEGDTTQVRFWPLIFSFPLRWTLEYGIYSLSLSLSLFHVLSLFLLLFRFLLLLMLVFLLLFLSDSCLPMQGGSSGNINLALTADYKNKAVFSSFAAGQILIVVHSEGKVLGWRAWDMVDTTKPLAFYLQGGDNRYLPGYECVSFALTRLQVRICELIGCVALA